MNRLIEAMFMSIALSPLVSASDAFSHALSILATTAKCWLDKKLCRGLDRFPAIGYTYRCMKPETLVTAMYALFAETANSEQRTANSEQRTANSEQRTANSEQRNYAPQFNFVKYLTGCLLYILILPVYLKARPRSGEISAHVCALADILRCPALGLVKSLLLWF